MSTQKRRNDHARKREPGGYVPLAHVVLRSPAFSRLSRGACKLVLDLLSQYRGDNNGDLCVAWTVMERRGWKSRDTLYRALKELLDGKWIEVTRQGGKHRCSLYAFTFFAIDPCKGKLDVDSTHSPRGTWRLNDPPAPLESKKLKSLTR